jgi:heme-degrading monooxygenase HmoA
VAERGDGFILLDGANELSSVRQFWWVIRHWSTLRRGMRSSPGYIRHRLWCVPPRTIGLTSWWEDAGAAYRFAHSPAHLLFWRWGAEPGHTRGGWLAIYRYVEGGPLWGNGVETMVRAFGSRVPAPTNEPARMPPSGG